MLLPGGGGGELSGKVLTVTGAETSTEKLRNAPFVLPVRASRSVCFLALESFPEVSAKRSSQVFLGGCQVEYERKNKNIRIMKTVTEDVIKN